MTKLFDNNTHSYSQRGQIHEVSDMEKLLIYNLNLEPFDEDEIKKEIFNPIIVDSYEVEDFDVEEDYNTEESLDYARPQQKETSTSVTSFKSNSTVDFNMTLRPRTGIKSLAYLDQKPDTPTDLDSDLDLDSETVTTKCIQDGCELRTDLTAETDEESTTKQIDIEEISLSSESNREIEEFCFDWEKSERASEIDIVSDNITQETSSDYLQESLFIERDMTRATASSRLQETRLTEEFKLRKRKPLIVRCSYNRHKRPGSNRDNKYRTQMERLRRKNLKCSLDRLKNVIPNLLHRDIAPKILIIKEASALCKALREEQSQLDIVKKDQIKINKLLLKKLQNFVDCPITTCKASLSFQSQYTNHQMKHFKDFSKPVLIECGMSDTSSSLKSQETNPRNNSSKQKNRYFEHSYSSNLKSISMCQRANRESIRRKNTNILFDTLTNMIPNLKGQISETLILNESTTICKALSNRQSQLNMIKQEQRKTNRLLRIKLRDLIAEVVF